MEKFQKVFKFRDIERHIYDENQYNDLLQREVSELQRIKLLNNKELFSEMINFSFDDYSSYTGSCDKITWYYLKEELENRLSNWLEK